MTNHVQSKYYLGMDGGGTKTYVVITDDKGVILGEGAADGANPHNVPVHHAIANIQNAIDFARKDMLTRSGGELNEMIMFEGACLGLAGLDTHADIELVVSELKTLQKRDQTFGAKRMIMVNDGLIGLHSATDKQWGIAIIAGTGANCYGISEAGQEAVAGDWGFLMGDQGSAYAVGQALLKIVMKEYDGRKDKTMITSAVLDFLNLEAVPELVAWAYHGVVPVHEIAKLALVLEQPFVRDLPETREILDRVKAAIVDAYLAVTDRLKMTANHDVTVALLGGLFRLKGGFGDDVSKLLKSINPHAHVIFPERSPAEGAASYARKLVSQAALVPESAYVVENVEL